MLSAFPLLIRLYIPVNIIYIILASLITVAFIGVNIYLSTRGHMNQFQALQVEQVAQNAEMETLMGRANL